MMKRALVLGALLTGAVALSQTATVSEMKAPVGNLSGASSANTTAELWSQTSVLPASSLVTVVTAPGAANVTVAPTVLARPPSPLAKSTPVIWKKCADENGVCRVTRATNARYGVGNVWKTLNVPGAFSCSNRTFGDPVPGTVKLCQIPYDEPVTAAFPRASVTPIASEFDRRSRLWTGFPIPGSMAPDVVGAFRFVCAPGQMSYDDPILYPGVKGGSAHLHQFYGNILADYRSTYSTLRTAGNSTCSDELNRSAYWVPALFNGKGMVIRPDFLAIYYKRHRDGDPACRLEASDGCVDLPTGLRVVSGFDMTRMGLAQPDNRTFTHRCVSPGKPSVHRGTLAEAVADCGGAGQIMTAINFGSCWNGQLDSADHRSHVTRGAYIGHSYAECPASHPYIIPELTQQIAYTITAADGAIYFASDKMNGMNMAGGSTFHADYMEGWDPPTREVWHRNCIGKMLNCSDGVLGDGSMMKRGALPSLSNPRLVAAPSR